MPQRAATIESLPMAFEVVKQMQADGLEWGEGYRPLGRRALAEIIEGRMAELRHQHLLCHGRRSRFLTLLARVADLDTERLPVGEVRVR